jgi:hypothetical protein
MVCRKRLKNFNRRLLQINLTEKRIASNHMSHKHELLSSERELPFYDEHFDMSNGVLHLDTDVSVGADSLTPLTASNSLESSPTAELNQLESASANINSTSYKRMMRLVRNREAARR